MAPAFDPTHLGGEHPPELVAELRDALERGGRVELTPGRLAAGTSHGASQALDLLQDAVEAGWLEREEEWLCPAEECREPLDEGGRRGDVCPHCEEAFVHHGGPLQPEVRFVADLPPPRQAPWVLALHGMNTRGDWQEELNWRLATTWAEIGSRPVAIYKYGRVLAGVLVPFRQRFLLRRLERQLRLLTGQTTEGGLGGRPDVVAHSFGTWLLGHLLRDHPELEVGRVILLGCILRPDFDWAELRRRGQVEEVLNHHGTRDFWAGVAHYVIPDCGPSGRRGFDDPVVVNVPAEGFTHSQFFGADLDRLYAATWKPFLTWPAGRLAALPRRSHPERTWRQVPWPLRATLPRWAILSLVSLLAVVLVLALCLGLGELWTVAKGIVGG